MSVDRTFETVPRWLHWEKYYFNKNKITGYVGIPETIEKTIRKSGTIKNVEILNSNVQIIVYVILLSQQNMASDFTKLSTINGWTVQSEPYQKFGPVRILAYDPDFWSEICWSGLESDRIDGTDLIRSVIRKLFSYLTGPNSFEIGPVRIFEPKVQFISSL